jgi:hypothetical protein
MSLKRVRRADAIGKQEFHRRLRFWLEYCDDKQIGSEDVPGVTDWIFVRDSSDLFALHADTKRPAVDTYLKLVEKYGEDLLWQLTTSNRGKATAVKYGPDVVRHTAFYFYFKS